MKRRHRRQKRRPVKVIRLWSLPEARRAVPYLRSITGSLREHWLAAQDRRLIARRLVQAHGRPDRAKIIAQQHASQDQSDAEERFGNALDELMGIDVYLLDPVQGIAFIPFQKEQGLAWFVFDHFDTDGIRSWRFHEDPLDTRRPIAEIGPEIA